MQNTGKVLISPELCVVANLFKVCTLDYKIKPLFFHINCFTGRLGRSKNEARILYILKIVLASLSFYAGDSPAFVACSSLFENVHYLVPSHLTAKISFAS